MKRAILTVAVLALAATPAVAQYGSVGIYSDATGCDCNVYDQVPGIVNVWIVHRDITQGVTGVSFAIADGGGMTLAYVGESKVGGPIEITGNLVDGYWVGYSSCIAGGLTIMQIQFFGTATSAPCSWLEIAPAPGYAGSGIEAADCDALSVAASGLRTPVNPDAGCVCVNPGCLPVPVDESTWGGIKALYR